MKVVIVGSGLMLMNLIAGCEDYGCKIVGVLIVEQCQTPFLMRYFKNILNPSKDYTYVKSHNLHIIKSKSVNSSKFKREILKLNADVILVGSWSEKFRQDIIDLPTLCTINAHPSLLPKYRGPNPYLQVIKHLETESGVTFHLMNSKYDAGEILSQRRVKVLETDTSKELRERITQEARLGIKELFENLETDIIIPIEQNENIATYYKQSETKDLLLDFAKSAREVAAHIRAFSPWSKTYFSHKKLFLCPDAYKLEIAENTLNKPVGTISVKNSKKLMISVVCGDNKVLKMTGVKLIGLMKPLSYFYIKYFVKSGDKVL